jgi:hypothetical protein
VTDFSGNTFSGIASLPWEVLGPESPLVSIGLVLSSSTPSFIPDSFLVNGVGE